MPAGKSGSRIWRSNLGMPSGSAYEPVLSGKASSFLIGVSKTRQKKLIALIFQISEHPGQLGDWQFSFWPDHAVRELRFTEIAEL